MLNMTLKDLTVLLVAANTNSTYYVPGTVLNPLHLVTYVFPTF